MTPRKQFEIFMRDGFEAAVDDATRALNEKHSYFLILNESDYVIKPDYELCDSEKKNLMILAIPTLNGIDGSNDRSNRDYSQCKRELINLFNERLAELYGSMLLDPY